VANSIVAKGKATGNYKDFEYEIIKTFTMESPVSENDFNNKNVQDLTNILFKAAQEDYQMKLNY
jgi:preprotein translocase subunit SecA